jgi:hemin uptake protein HemP
VERSRPGQAPPRDAAAEDAAKALPRLAASQLFGEASELELIHQGEVYRLRITRNGKLILTK